MCLPVTNTPTKEEWRNGMRVKNVCTCTLCGSSADRFKYHIQCCDHSGHVADLMVGIFIDLTFPKEE